MRRPRRTAFMRVRKPSRTSYIEVSSTIGLATGVAANYSLLLCSDSPDKGIITNMSSTIAQVENNTRILKGSFINLQLLATTVPVIATVWVYMNYKGMVVAPTDGTDFNEGPQTLANAELRKNTIFYRRFPLSVNEWRNYRIPLFSRRNNFLADPTSVLAMEIHNTGAAGGLSILAYGRIKTLEG